MPFLLAEILNFQGSTHRIGVGSFSKFITSEKKIQHTKALKTVPEIGQCYWARMREQ